MLLLIDNHDSFTYNIAHSFGYLNQQVKVISANQTLAEVTSLSFDYLVIGPGPGHPSKAHLSLSCLKAFFNKIPILGICLGHQIIGTFFNMKTIKAKRPLHGKTKNIHHKNQDLFQNLQSPLKMTQYNSLILDPTTLPSFLTVTAYNTYNEIMAISHNSLIIKGLQFHPESHFSDKGLSLLESFLNYSY